MFIGVDIIEIEKVKLLIKKEHYIDKVFTKEEIELVKGYSERRSVESLAGRFAVKEAVVKALGTGFDQGILLTDIETLKDEKGKPVLFLYNKAKKRAQELSISTLCVSISHCELYAVGMVAFS
ncbi:MAG: holo-ACP synthase [Marinisporobacter sp.]|jgi:holo-[acyl-carrier protein] synthase|nr:holo-ACP synthase [Marinisporobacter sp.]